MVDGHLTLLHPVLSQLIYSWKGTSAVPFSASVEPAPRIGKQNAVGL